MLRNRLIAAFVVVATATAMSLLGTPAHAQPSAPVPAGACTLRPNPHSSPTDEWRSCLSVSASVDHALGVGQTATVRFDVTAQHADNAVQIEADLPGNLRWVTVPAGLRTAAVASHSPLAVGGLDRASGQRSMAANQTLHFEGVVTAVSAGQVELPVRARIAVPGGTDVAQDTVYLTVGGAGRASALTLATATHGGTTPVTEPVTPTRPTGPAKSDPAAPKPRAITPQSTSCVSGAWFYLDNNGATRASRKATVEARTGGTVLATGETGFDGRYSVCFNNVAAGQNVFVRFTMKNTYWRVRVTGTNNDYAFDSPTFFLANGASHDFGGLQPADNTVMRGLHAFDEAYDAWLWHPGLCWASNHTTCRQLNINWSSTSTDGTNYSLAGNDVHLQAADPDAPITVVHEIGHGIMDETYNDAFPSAPNCNPHTIPGSTSTGCAWTEGWAEWFPASVYNDPFFRWPNGGSQSLEAPTWGTAGWANGDTVEGRVAGALIDISDTNNEAFWDGYGEGAPGNVWTTFSNHVSNTFADFWNQRGADGFNVADSGALACLYQNTIDYTFRNPLGDNASLTRPTPTPHNYSYNTTTVFWSVVGIRPPAGSDDDLALYDDRAQGTILATSAFGGSTVDFVAVDSNHRPLGDYYPRVNLFSGGGNYQIELAQGANSLGAGGSQAITMGTGDVVAVRDVFLSAGVAVTLRAVPGNSSQDPELFLMASDGTNPGTWYQPRVNARVSASAAGPGGTETITFTPTVSDWYGLVLVNKAGSGTYTLTRS